MDDLLKGFHNEILSPNVSRLDEIYNLATVPKIPEHLSNPAHWTHKRLCEYIRDFEADLDNEHEIGARLVSFGQTIIFHVEDIGYYGPDIVTFYGLNQHGERVQLIQNISQLSVMLVAMKKIGEKPRRIGFKLCQQSKTPSDEE